MLQFGRSLAYYNVTQPARLGFQKPFQLQFAHIMQHGHRIIDQIFFCPPSSFCVTILGAWKCHPVQQLLFAFLPPFITLESSVCTPIWKLLKNDAHQRNRNKFWVLKKKIYTVLHMYRHDYFLAGNHENWVLSMLPHNLSLILNGMIFMITYITTYFCLILALIFPTNGCCQCVRLRESRDSHVQRPICYHHFDVLLWWNLSVKNCISFSLTFLLQKYFQLINGLESVSFKTRQFIKIIVFLHNLSQLSISL